MTPGAGCAINRVHVSQITLVSTGNTKEAAPVVSTAKVYLLVAEKGNPVIKPAGEITLGAIPWPASVAEKATALFAEIERVIVADSGLFASLKIIHDPAVLDGRTFNEEGGHVSKLGTPARLSDLDGEEF